MRASSEREVERHREAHAGLLDLLVNDRLRLRDVLSVPCTSRTAHDVKCHVTQKTEIRWQKLKQLACDTMQEQGVDVESEGLAWPQ